MIEVLSDITLGIGLANGALAAGLFIGRIGQLKWREMR